METPIQGPQIKTDTLRFDDISGFIESRTDVPTYIPKKVSEQIVLVRGATTSVYIYDFSVNTWKSF